MNDIIIKHSNNKHEKDENLNAPKENKIWTCKNCKEEVEDNFDFCWNCNYDKNGSLLTWQNQSLSLNKNLESINSSEKNKAGWGIIQWGLAIIIGIILIAYYKRYYSDTDSNYSPSSISRNSAPTNSVENSLREDNNKNADIMDYLNSHTFSYNGNGRVTFSNELVTIRGSDATMQGKFYKSSKKSVRFSIRAIDGLFDASNNRTCYGSFILNDNGTLEEILSDGVHTKKYTLIPE